MFFLAKSSSIFGFATDYSSTKIGELTGFFSHGCLWNPKRKERKNEKNINMRKEPGLFILSTCSMGPFALSSEIQLVFRMGSWWMTGMTFKVYATPWGISFHNLLWNGLNHKPKIMKPFTQDLTVDETPLFQRIPHPVQTSKTKRLMTLVLTFLFRAFWLPLGRFGEKPL